MSCHAITRLRDVGNVEQIPARKLQRSPWRAAADMLPTPHPRPFPYSPGGAALSKRGRVGVCRDVTRDVTAAAVARGGHGLDRHELPRDVLFHGIRSGLQLHQSEKGLRADKQTRHTDRKTDSNYG